MSNLVSKSKRIGILSPGELGAGIGKLLVEAGFDVLTTLEDRSERTRKICLEAGLQSLATMREVVQSSDIILSFVPPAASIKAAEQYCSLAAFAPRDQLYVDVNSISPATARQIGELVASAGLRFVDASIHGQAAKLRSAGTLYLSGEAAEEVAELFSGHVRVKLLGRIPGQASAFKMLMGGMSKGMIALFIEMGLVARSAGLLDEVLNDYQHYYPGVMEAIERMLPTYPRHALRRSGEMQELEQMVLSLGMQPGLISEARRLITAVGELDLTRDREDKELTGWSVKEVIEQIFLRISNRQD